jgi:hypothetical protein
LYPEDPLKIIFSKCTPPFKYYLILLVQLINSFLKWNNCSVTDCNGIEGIDKRVGMRVNPCKLDHAKLVAWDSMEEPREQRSL